MSVGLFKSDDVAYNGTSNIARMDLFADSSADLVGLTSYDNIVLLQGSSIKDISTGDKYIMQSNGTWVLQPSQDISINVPDYDQLEDAVISLQAADVSLTDNKMDANFTPETSSPSVTNSLRIRFAAPRSNNELTMLVGKLNSTTNYVQFYINGIDKGYITFDVSRNVDVWE